MAFLEGRGLRLRLGGIAVKFLMDYSIQGSSWWNPISASGHVDISLLPSGTSLQAVLRPYLTSQGELRVSIEDVDIHFEMEVIVPGLFVGNLIETIVWVADTLMRHQIEAMLGRIINNLDDDFLNPMLNDLFLEVPLGLPRPNDGMTLNFAICDVEFTDTYASVALSGETFDINDPQLSYGVAPVSIPHQPPTQDRMITVALTKWTINSALWMLSRKGLFETTLRSEDLLHDVDGASIDFNTKWLSLQGVPKLAWAPKKPFTLSISTMGSPSVAIDDGIAVSASLNLTFSSVEPDGSSDLLFSLGVPLKLSAHPRVTDGSPQKIIAGLQPVSFTPVTVLATTQASGTVYPSVLEAELNIITNSFIKKSQEALGSGMELPVVNGFGLTDLSLNFGHMLFTHANIVWDW